MQPLVVLGMIGLAAAPLRAAPGDPDAKAVDSVFARYDHTNGPGCALGVMRDGRIVYSRGYGMADLNQGVPIRPTTVFYIASTSKQFTAFAIALLAEDGTLSLDDPVRKWIPELAAYTDPVSIRHLLHHTSGIRDYLGLWSLSGRSFADEIPQAVGLDLIARQTALDFVPGSRWSYSNSGYLLLSEIVKRASGKSLRQFTTERMFQPLGMTDTHFHDDNAMVVPRRAEGYQPAGGGYQIVRTSFALVGDGGLMTTVEDMAKWERNFSDNRLGRGGPGVIDQVTTVGHTNDGKPLDYAFGLMRGTHRGLATIDHGGSFIGFRAQMIRFPAERFAVTVLCNDYTANPDQLARQVADLYLADRLAPAASGAGAPKGASVSADRLERWVGSYVLSPGTVGRVTRDSAGLVLAAFGVRARMAPASDSVFTAPPIPGAVVFRTGPGGPMIMASGVGMAEPSARLAPAPRLTAAEAAGYAGRYRSEELDTWAVVEARGDTVKLRARWDEWRTLEPIARDVFGVAGVQVSFGRDRQGRVTGYRMSAARTLNLGFLRETPSPRAPRAP